MVITLTSQIAIWIWKFCVDKPIWNLNLTSPIKTSIWQTNLGFNLPLTNWFMTLTWNPLWSMWFGTSILKPQFSSWIETWIWVFIINKILDVTFKMSIWHFFLRPQVDKPIWNQHIILVLQIGEYLGFQFDLGP
jgi:hypothetical protein